MGNAKTSNTSKSAALFWTSLIAILLSILNHAYLLVEHYRIRYGEATGSSFCNINDLFSCAAVSASQYSEFAGIPIALWGLAANCVLGGLFLFYAWGDESKKASARRNVLLVGALIALASIVMGSISTFVLSRFCPFCIVAYALSFIAFGSLWLYTRDTDTAVPSAPLTSGFTPLAILSGIALLGVFVTHQQALMHYKAKDLEPYIRQSIQEWQSQAPREIEAHEPLVMGAPAETAKMIITEFADYRCIHCKTAAPTLKAFVTAHSEDVRLEFMTWPLDGECNTSISQANGASCLLARAVHCVEKTTGQGWNAQAFVFDNQDRFTTKAAVEALLPEIAQAGGMDPKEIETCVESPEIRAAIEKQAAIGTSLNLRGTPAIFVNGKSLPFGQRIQTLEEIYRLVKSSQTQR